MRTVRVRVGILFAGVAMALAWPAGAEQHALVLSISNYRSPVPPLPGVAKDPPKIRAIAKKMGVRDENIVWANDNELTLDGLRSVFERFERRVQPGDQVFIYYSGHGTRTKVRESDGQERCAEALVSVDGKLFMDSDLEAWLGRLSGRASRTVMFLDSCHSGGVTTRKIGAGAGRFRPRNWAPTLETCDQPSNMVTRGIATAHAGAPIQNAVYIAAARDTEVALDDEDSGGLATDAWFRCMTGAAVDADRSGGLTAEEIQTCAQKRINRFTRDMPEILPHSITITGNSGMVLKFADPETGVRASPPHVLRDIASGADRSRKVVLEADRSVLRIGEDKVSFKLTSSHSGFVYLLMADATGNSFDLLFPNRLDQDNWVESGHSVLLPRQTWQLVSAGPPGDTIVLALVSDAPRSFDRLGLQPTGPFSTIAADGQSAASLQAVVQRPDQQDICGARRTLRAKVAECSSSYGASLVELTESAK